jgi:hypothetical protein
MMSEWPTTRADSGQFSDTPTDEFPVVRDQLWTPFCASAMTYRERAPAPRSRWAQVLATVRRYARLPALVAIYLGVVVAASLLVARFVHTPVKGTSEAGTRHQQEQHYFVPHRSPQYQPSASRKPPAIRPVGTISPPSALSPVRPSPVSRHPLPRPPASKSPPPPPSPTPTTPAPTPTTPPPTPTTPPPTPTTPPPTPTTPAPTPT